MDDPATVTDVIDTTVRVATWNIWWRFGPWEERQPRIIEELRGVDADIIALQEVWGADGTDAGAVIAAELGYESTYVGLLEMDRGVWFGNAVLSRWPIDSSEHRRLPPGDAGDEVRNVMRADVAGPRGTIQVFSTHLNWRFDQSHIRQQQVETITRFIRDSPARDYPPVVCGDFNAQPDSDEIRTLTGLRPVSDGVLLVDCWQSEHPGEPGLTWNNENPFVAEQLEPHRRIDYVFAGWPKARGAGRPVAAELFGATPIDGMYPSDHYGVVADLRY